MKDYIYNLESINPGNKNTPQTHDQYDPRTCLVYQVCQTDCDGKTQRFEYTIKQFTKKKVNLYCHIKKCRALLSMPILENGELKIGKVPTKTGGEKWGWTKETEIEKIKNILNYGPVDHRCNKLCERNGRCRQLF